MRDARVGSEIRVSIDGVHKNCRVVRIGPAQSGNLHVCTLDAEGSPAYIVLRDFEVSEGAAR